MTVRTLVCAAVMTATILPASVIAAQDHVHPVDPSAPMHAHSMNNTDLPADEEHAKARLSTSRRHAEWVTIRAGGSEVNTWLVYPERRAKAPVVVVVQETVGLTDWIRAVADQLASEGFIALAPDLAGDEVNARLNAVREYGLRLPAASGRSATIGFGWGASISLVFAATQPALDAAVVYDATASADPVATEAAFGAASLADFKVPILALYGDTDAAVIAAASALEARMKASTKIYEHETFNDAGYGFLRVQMATAANMKATELAWPRTIAFLRKYTEGTRRP
jgi:carboxymethylenebutenolidase